MYGSPGIYGPKKYFKAVFPCLEDFLTKENLFPYLEVPPAIVRLEVTGSCFASCLRFIGEYTEF